MQVASNRWGSQLQDWEQLSEEIPMSVGIFLDTLATWSDELRELLVTSSKNMIGSPGFQAAKKRMLSVLSERRQAVDEVPVLIRCYTASDLELQTITQLITRQRQFCQEARQAADASDPSTPFYCDLRFREVSIAVIQEYTGFSLLQYGADITFVGVRLDSLTPPMIEVQEQNPHEFMDAMVQFFPLHDQGVTQHRSGVVCVSVRGFSPLKAYPAFLSAVAASSCVRKMDLFPYFNVLFNQASPQQQLWLWSWLAYSAFLWPRGGGKRGVQEIVINASALDQAAVDGMTQILQAANPVATLFSLGGSDVAPETVSATQFALLDPSSPNGRRLPRWSYGYRFDNLPVIGRTNDWISVLLPRWGRAWVHRDDFVASDNTTTTATQIQSIPHVSLLDVVEASRRAVAALLRVVGQGIRHLNVSSLRHRKTAAVVEWEDMCHDIWQACPALESLQLHGLTMRLATLDCIFDAIASGSCRLQKLTLECDQISAGSRSLRP